MEKSKYHIRVMRPTFQRAILSLEASSEEAAIRDALAAASRLTDSEWGLLATEREQPVVEIALSEVQAEESDAAIVAFLCEVQHAYALLQASLVEGRGCFIVPSWLQRQPRLAIADITQDWHDALTSIHQEGIEEFIAWLRLQTRPTNVANFLAERDRCPDCEPPDGQ